LPDSIVYYVNKATVPPKSGREERVYLFQPWNFNRKGPSLSE